MLTTLLLSAALAGDPPTPTGPAEPQLLGDNLESVRQLINGTNWRESGCTAQGPEDCYEYRLRSNETLAGRVVVRWTVADSKVADARVLVNTTGDADLGSCLAKRIGKWRFASAPDGDTTWPFVFRRR